MKAMLAMMAVALVAEGATWSEKAREANRLREAGQTEEAERLYREVVAQAQRSGAADPNAMAELNAAGVQLHSLARYREAETLYRLALEAWAQRGTEAPLTRAVILGNLGAALTAMGRYPEAERALLESLDGREAAEGPGSVEAGRAEKHLALLYFSWGDYGKAESRALRAVEMFEERPEAPPRDRSESRELLATIYVAQHRATEAEAVLQRALADAGGSLVVNIYSAMAAAALARGDAEQAEVCARKALDQARLVLPARHPFVAAALNNLAQAERFQQRYLEAEKHYRQAIEIWEDTLGPSHPDFAKGLANLGAFYHERGREAGAEDLYSRAAGIFETAFGKNDPQVLVARNELADVFRAQRRYTESERLGRATLAALEKMLGPRDSRVERALSNYALLLNDTRRRKEAQAIVDRLRRTQQTFR